ncbi:hypothetical protein HYH02_010008 [Chlamydomonas schloesseri]|uniref:Uncharacterized protein n=1 Tax=Chlamydomonas schloesseri TaxID=2026947 RepID=A0A835TM56_9CHLO|nr:hypothetical protein HYH02_010008 [Chlamydomonas schloesseri]|eukprot:KAG2441420.1 hypothetical protein HYH02_010008 [Chlamydomonas schloesseri]
MHSPHGAATSALVTPHSARTPAAAGDAAACCHESCGTPDGAGREAVPSPHGPMNGGRAPRSSPAAEPSPSPPPEQQRTSPQHPSPNACVEEGGGAHAPRLGLTTAKSAPVHGSPSVVGAGGSGHEAGQEAEGASVRRERRRRSEALARVEEEDAAEVERPAAAPAAQGGQLRLLTEEAFLATVSSAPALAEPAQAGARSAGVRSGVCLGGGPTGPRFAEVGWMVDGAAGAQEGVRERPQSAAGCSASEPVPSPSGSAHASRRVSEAAGLVAAVDNSMHTSATPPPAATVQPSNLQDAEPFPPPAQPAVSAARSPLQAAPHRSSPAQPPKHAWPAAAVAAARASRPASAMPLQQPSRSPAAAPRASGTPAAAQPQQLRPSPSSRQPVPSTGSPVAAGPTRRAPFAAAAASPAAAPVRSPAPGSAARSGAGAAAAGASPFVSMYGSAASGRLRSTPPPPHAFSMQASASTRLALQDVLSSRRSMNRGGGGGFSSSMSVSGLGGNIDFRPKWRF